MTLTDSILVVVPARGGSKRINKKNIKPIAGQPMIYWPLMELSKFFQAASVIVSTDDSEIASHVESKGLKIPFMRPDELSGDFVGTFEVISHALDWYEKNVSKVNYVVTVYPTAVLLSMKDIINAVDTLKADLNCDSVMSATNYPSPIQRAVYINKDGFAKMFQPNEYLTRSQDLTEAFHDAGQFYVNTADSIRSKKILTTSNVKLHYLKRNNVVDIDSMEDFYIAEEKLKLSKSRKNFKTWSF